MAAWRFGKNKPLDQRWSDFYVGKDTNWLYFKTERGFVALTGLYSGSLFTEGYVTSGKGVKRLEANLNLEIIT